MGLLTRARSVETGSGRPVGSAAPTRTRGGLLARSRLLLLRTVCPVATLFAAPIAEEELEQARAPRGQAPAARDPEQVRSALLALPPGVEAPGRLFALLCDHLALTRAALLLYDPARSVFAPWASCGLDQTTVHRLRLPLEAGGPLQPLEGGEALLLREAAQREPLRRYFSTREHATMQWLLLYPLLHEQRLIAVLLATQSRRPLEEPALAALHCLDSEAAALLYRSRGPLPEPTRSQGLEGQESARERVLEAAQVAAARGHRLALIRVSLEGLTRLLREANPLADTFRLREELQRLVLAMFQWLGGVVGLDSEGLLLIVASVKKPDVELLTAHLRAGLRHLVPQLAEVQSLDLREAARVCDPSPQEAAACLAELL